MSYPAGRTEWAWEWMGFSPPSGAYGPPIDAKYNKFRHCFNFYSGIGTFDYWRRVPLQSLSDEQALELVQLLMEDNKKRLEVRKYLGINEDGTLNKSIDPFADGRTEFFEKLTLEECRKQEYPHNQRRRRAEGYECDDCGNFIGSQTEEWLRTEGISRYGNSIHNLKVYFHREKTELPQDVIDLKSQCDELRSKNVYEVPLDEIEAMISNHTLVMRKYRRVIERGENG